MFWFILEYWHILTILFSYAVRFGIHTSAKVLHYLWLRVQDTIPECCKISLEQFTQYCSSVLLKFEFKLTVRSAVGDVFLNQYTYAPVETRKSWGCPWSVQTSYFHLTNDKNCMFCGFCPTFRAWKLLKNTMCSFWKSSAENPAIIWSQSKLLSSQIISLDPSA